MLRKAMLVGTLLASATAAHAQTARTSVSDDNASQIVGDIVVTAQRRSEPSQNVPIALTALSSDQLQRRGITQTLDLIRAVPNLQGSTNTGIGSANTYFLRGLGNVESIATFDPPVGTYVDDVYISRQNANNFAFFDVDRIEVLRGPQGTLFGRNTTGGAINVVLKAPAKEVGGFAEAGYGRFNRVELRASLDLPVTENILTKISGYYLDDNGYVFDTATRERLNDERGYGVRGAVRFTPTQSVTWDVSADYIDAEGLNVINRQAAGGRTAQTGFSRSTSSSPFVFAPGATPFVKGRKAFFGQNNIAQTLSLTSHVRWDVGGATIEAITGWRDLRQRYGADFADGDLATFFAIPNYPTQSYATGGFTVLNDGRHRQFSQEFKVNGAIANDRLKYVAGVFYLQERNRTDFADVLTSSIPLAPGLPPGFPVLSADRILHNNVFSKAAYVQADLALMERITLTAGIRYTDDRKTIGLVDQRDATPFIDPATRLTTANLVANGIPTELISRVWTPRFAINYRPSNNVLLFASATRGFKSGGWSARATEAATVLPFFPEKVWSYEAGIKSDLLGRRLRVNANYFHLDVDDFQVPSSFASSTGPVLVTRNFAGLRNDGVELEVTAVPITGLNLFGNIGVQRARLVDIVPAILAQQAACKSGQTAQCGQGIVTVSGSIAEPTRSPRFTFSGGFDYRLALGGSGLSLVPAASANYAERNPIDTANTVFQQSHWIVDASVALQGADRRWSLSAECRNCFGEVFPTSIIPPAPVYLNPPARWMVRARYNF